VNVIASRLIGRLITIQLGIVALASLLTAAFAQRLLLLDDDVSRAAFTTALGMTVAMALLVTGATLLAVRRVRPALRALSLGSSAVEPTALVALDNLPIRLAVLDVLGAGAMCLISLVSPLRPASIDLVTQSGIVVLEMTINSAAVLPLYVMMRSAVGKALELAPAATARDAALLVADGPAQRKRIGSRILLAVVGPVAFVALGASLLVHAHARKQEFDARAADARTLVRGVLELAPTDAPALGRHEAIQAARALGYEVDTAAIDKPSSPGTAPPGAATPAPVPAFTAGRDEQGRYLVVTPLASGQAIRVRFFPGGASDVLGVFVVLSAIAISLAGILGSRLGAALSADVAVVMRELKTTGALDVIKGTRMPRATRFGTVATLMGVIEELGGVFREFASAQERAIEARAATERMRGLFLASMSHDLKAPLNSILGFAGLVMRGDLTEGQRESVGIIEQRGKELLTLIQIILDSARVEAGELDVTPEWTMVGDVVMAAVLEARELAVGTNVQVSGEIQPGVPKLFVDPICITQALTQVIMSAVRFCDQGVVNVRATVPAQGDRLRIDVEASGRGLPQSELEKIFEAFQHVDRARRHGSLGLGLSLARSILEIHKGTVDIDPQSSTVGTVFHVWLPLTERPSERRMPAIGTEDDDMDLTVRREKPEGP
jgi:signal transduction histidine kinase